MTKKPMTLAECLARMPINKWPTGAPPSVATRSRCEEFDPVPNKPEDGAWPLGGKPSFPFGPISFLDELEPVQFGFTEEDRRFWEAAVAAQGPGKSECMLTPDMSNEEIDRRVEKLIAEARAAHNPADLLGSIRPVIEPSIEPVNDDDDQDLFWHVTRGVEVMLAVDKEYPRTLTIYAGYAGDECLDVGQVEKLAKCLTDIAEWMRQWDDLNGVEEE